MTLDLNGISFKALSSDLLKRYAGKNDPKSSPGRQDLPGEKTATFAEQDETKNDEAALKSSRPRATTSARTSLRSTSSTPTRREAAAHPKSEGRSSELELGVAGGEERTRSRRAGADSEERGRTCSDPLSSGRGWPRPGEGE